LLAYRGTTPLAARCRAGGLSFGGCDGPCPAGSTEAAGAPVLPAAPRWWPDRCLYLQP